LAKRIDEYDKDLGDIVNNLTNKLNDLDWRPREFIHQNEHLKEIILKLGTIKENTIETSEDFNQFSKNVEKIEAKEYDSFLKNKFSGKQDVDTFAKIVDSFDEFEVKNGNLTKIKDPFEGLTEEEKLLKASKDLKLSKLLVEEYYKNIIKSGMYEDMCNELDIHMKFMNENNILKDITIEPEYIKYSIARSLGLQYEISNDFCNRQFGASDNNKVMILLEKMRNESIKKGDYKKSFEIEQKINELLLMGTAAGATKLLMEYPFKIVKEFGASMIDDFTSVDKWKKTGEYLIKGNYYEGDVAFQGVILQCCLAFTGLDAPCDVRDLFYDFTHFNMDKKWAIQTGLDGLCLLPVIGMFKKFKNVDKIDDVAALGKNLDKAQMLKLSKSFKSYNNIIKSLKTDFKFIQDNVKRVIDTGKGYICVLKDNTVLVLSKSKLKTEGVEEYILNTFKNFCFDGKTLVKVKDIYKMIKDIEIGDYVYSQNTLTGDKLYKKVLDKYEGNTKEFVKIYVENDIIRVTKPHRFFMSDGKWKQAGQIEAGNEIIDSKGECKVVSKVEEELLDEVETVYNLNVEDFHTYFVAKGSLLVHNEYKPPKVLNSIKFKNLDAVKDICGSSVPNKILETVDNYKIRGTVIDLYDKSGNVIYRMIKPIGYKNIDELLSAAKRGEVDVKKWGYSSYSEFEEVVQNVNKYLNSSSHKKAPSIMNSQYANGKHPDGLEFDPLGFPVFKSNDIKTELNLLSNYNKNQLKNMSRTQHLKAATREYCNILKDSAKKQASLDGVAYNDEYLKSFMKKQGFDDEQVNAILKGKDKIPGWTWHHHPETGKMQLVDQNVHNPELGNPGHSGGDSIWGKE
jgi:hypothetical protein